MNTLTLLYIFFVAIAVVLMAALFAMNDSCKKAEELNTVILKEYQKVTDDHNELIENYRKLAEENKELKARLLYERTKEDANVL
jgi:uncharacterized coiled-coil DUF342 family protein|nr:MAG TPA: protein of unknown function (DUF948) [Caudoviricetes sp.]